MGQTKGISPTANNSKVNIFSFLPLGDLLKFETMNIINLHRNWRQDERENHLLNRVLSVLPESTVCVPRCCAHKFIQATE